jgi:hypothetical protein
LCCVSDFVVLKASKNARNKLTEKEITKGKKSEAKQERARRISAFPKKKKKSC